MVPAKNSVNGFGGGVKVEVSGQDKLVPRLFECGEMFWFELECSVNNHGDALFLHGIVALILVFQRALFKQHHAKTALATLTSAACVNYARFR